MSEAVFRVDSGLYTIVEVSKDDLYEDTPMNRWLPALYGDGEYCYVDSNERAKTILRGVVKSQIDALEEKLNSI